MEFFNSNSSILVEDPRNPSASLELSFDIVDQFAVFFLSKQSPLTKTNEVLVLRRWPLWAPEVSLGMSSSLEYYLAVFWVLKFPMLLPVSWSRGDLPTSTTLPAVRFPNNTWKRVYGLTIELTSFSFLSHTSWSDSFSATFTTRVSTLRGILCLQLLSRLCIAACEAPIACRAQTDRYVFQSRFSSSSLP